MSAHMSNLLFQLLFFFFLLTCTTFLPLAKKVYNIFLHILQVSMLYFIINISVFFSKLSRKDLSSRP